MKNNEWWLEIDPKADVDGIETYFETKNLLLEADPAGAYEKDIFNEDYFEKLHDKIMAKVEVTEMRKDKEDPVKKWRRLCMQWAAVACAIAVVVTAQPVQQQSTMQIASDQIFLQVSANPEELANTVLSHQSENDFLVDLAREKHDDLSVEQLNNLIAGEGSTDSSSNAN